MSLAGLPASPEHKLYRDLLRDIESQGRRDPLAAMVSMRAACEEDFWLFCKVMTSLGSYAIDDPEHPLYLRKSTQHPHGRLWIEHPDLFVRFREIQHILETREHGVWVRWFRGTIKTGGLVKCGSLWLLGRDKTERISVHTHKLDQVGESMGDDILKEITSNARLGDHWPQFRRLEEASTTRITVDRGPGPKEPSISIHPILGSATSGHYSFIFVDDAVTDKIIESAAETRKVDRQLSRLFPLRANITAPIVYIGTIWGETDPMLKRERQKKFSRVSHFPAQDSEGNWRVYTEAYFKQQRKGMDDHDFNAQYLLRITPRGDRYFKDSWKTTYLGTPEATAAGKRIHMICDSGGGEKESDYDIVRVVGLGADRRRYNLDLWRERAGLADMYDILFGEEDGVQTAWKRRPGARAGEGLVQYWKRLDPDLVLWVEQFGENLFYQALRAELTRRGLSVNLRKLPGIKRKKPTRIRALQPLYREGLILYPAQGFGHHSRDDERDTADQFWQDEYSLWTLDESGVLNDDGLDTEAWHCQPETLKLMSYPRVEPGAKVLEFPFDPFAARNRPAEVDYAQASWQVR